MSDFFKGGLDNENIIEADKQLCEQSNEEMYVGISANVIARIRNKFQK